MSQQGFYDSLNDEQEASFVEFIEEDDRVSGLANGDLVAKSESLELNDGRIFMSGEDDWADVISDWEEMRAN